MSETNEGEILDLLERLAKHGDHPAVYRMMSSTVREAAEKIRADSANVKELVEWYGGMGSFVDNYYFESIYRKAVSPDPAERRREWQAIMDECSVWTAEFYRLCGELLQMLKRRGFDTPRMRDWEKHILSMKSPELHPLSDEKIVDLEREVWKADMIRLGLPAVRREVVLDFTYIFCAVLFGVLGIIIMTIARRMLSWHVLFDGALLGVLVGLLYAWYVDYWA